MTEPTTARDRAATGARTDGAPCQLDVSACLPARVRADVGTSYPQAGPNCFATALKGAGLAASARGVDAGEMKAFARAFCVRVERPAALDLGVYVAPGEDPLAARSLWIHAFLHLTPNFVFEKQGVDYWGATPVRLMPFSAVDHRVRISPECRRFAPDPAVCANELTYWRCRPPDLPAPLAAAFGAIDELAEELLARRPLTAEDFRRWDDAYARAEGAAATEGLSGDLKDYVQERLASLRKQRAFFR